MPHTISVFGSAQAHPGDGLYEQGMRCGELLAAAGFVVMTGGYAGVMEAVSRGAQERGGTVIGVTAPAVFSDRPGANAFVTHERPAPHLLDRIHDMTHLSAAAITLPGSLGTLTELVAAWNLAFVSRFSDGTPKPLVTVGRAWMALVDHLAATLGADRNLVTTVDTVEEAVADISQRLGG
ncbi:MAG TPA: DNA-binding protein [Actinobacteria bacterium]|nr:DNA-binding protein [Actinomycetota bacterium]